MKMFAKALVAASALALASTANAAILLITPNNPANPAGTVFVTGGNIASGPITATIGHAGIPAGSFTDNFQFTIPQTGTGSGSVTTSVSFTDFLGATDVDFTSVLFNGLSASLVLRDASAVVCTTRGVGTCGADEQYALNNVAITAGVLNTLSVSGTSRGQGGYGGSLTFTPAAVPEPSTWAMMLVGFGAVGFGMRRSRKSSSVAMQAA